MTFFWDDLHPAMEGEKRDLVVHFLAKHEDVAEGETEFIEVEIKKRITVNKYGDIVKSELVNHFITFNLTVERVVLDTELEILSHSAKDLLLNNGVYLHRCENRCVYPLKSFKIKLRDLIDLYVNNSSYYMNPFYDIWGDLNNDKSMIVFNELYSPEQVEKRMKMKRDPSEEDIKYNVDLLMKRYKRIKDNILKNSEEEPVYPNPVFFSIKAYELIKDL